MFKVDGVNSQPNQWKSLSTLSIEHMGQGGSTKPNEVQLDNQHNTTFAKPFGYFPDTNQGLELK